MGEEIKEPITPEIVPEVEYEYTITDKVYGSFSVRKSPNAWWIDKGKVDNLISAFKIDASVGEACSYAGITHDQYRYFVEQHPDVSHVIKACRELPVLKARTTVVNALNDPNQAFRYLEKKKKKEFGNTLDITTKGESLNQEAKAKVDKAVDELLGIENPDVPLLQTTNEPNTSTENQSNTGQQ